MPANLFALAAGGVASWLVGDWVPLAAAGGASAAYLAFLSTMPSFRRAVRANSDAQTSPDVATPEEEEALLAELAPSQKEHYAQLKGLKARILDEYGKLPGGGVLQASSESRLDALLTSFLRLVATLNSYRKYLSAADKRAVEEELTALSAEVEHETNERLKEVKARRIDILKKRLARFVQADESREVVSHQLASIEDLLRLTHEQSIAIRDPQVVTRQLDALSAEVAATEETVRDMESFMLVTEELSSTPGAQAVKVRS
ncbi:MAG: hypothetical protein MUC96_26665 [Myxococcaceae bacterium]|nr:hypothetical protein [Myxococcaceae bacterium]